MLTPQEITRLGTWATVSPDDNELWRPNDRSLHLTALLLGAASELGEVPGFLGYAHAMGLESGTSPTPDSDPWASGLSVCMASPESRDDETPVTEDDARFWAQVMVANPAKAAKPMPRAYELLFDDPLAAVSVAHLLGTDLMRLRRIAAHCGAPEDTVSRVEAQALVVPEVAQAVDATLLNQHTETICAENALNHTGQDNTERLVHVGRWLMAGTQCVC